MTYPGGKNGSGVYQRIINNMPPHDIYIEGFCGSGAVLRHKKPARRNIALDRSQAALDLCASLQGKSAEVSFLCDDTLAVLPGLASLGEPTPFIDRPSTLIYLDPPYLPQTRKGGDLYNHELTEADHIRLLDMVSDARAMVMISGYPSALYERHIGHWHRVEYQTTTRRGMAQEVLWMNFEPPVALHDYRYLGEDYRARERIRRKARRWKKRIEAMDPQERQAIMEVLQSVK